MERKIIDITSDNDIYSSGYTSECCGGFNYCFKLEEGFSLILSQFNCSDDVVFTKEPAGDDTIVISYVLGSSAIKYELETDNGLSVEKQMLQASVFTFSNVLSLKMLPAADATIQHLWLVLNKEWLQEKMSFVAAGESGKIEQLLKPKKNFTIRKSLSKELSVVRNLMNYPFANTPETITHFELKAAANELLASYIKKALQVRDVVIDKGSVTFGTIQLKQIKSYIRQNIDRGTPILLPELAREFSMSEAGLKRYFQKLTNTNFTDFYNNERLKKAFDLIVGSKDGTIQEVASKLGYKNTSHFSKAFKAYYNFYPSEVRSKFSA
jgi:AraC-like DNA-binding protein